MTETLELTPIAHSSNIEARGYYPATQTMFVQFKGGKIYSYAEVPPELFAEWEAAPSAGSFFHARIRGVFAAELVPTEKE